MCLLSQLFFFEHVLSPWGKRLYLERGGCNNSARRIRMNYSLTSHKTSVKRIMIPNFSSLICITMCQIFLWNLKVLKVSNVLKPGKKTKLRQTSSMALVNYTRLKFSWFKGSQDNYNWNLLEMVWRCPVLHGIWDWQMNKTKGRKGGEWETCGVSHPKPNRIQSMRNTSQRYL